MTESWQVVIPLKPTMRAKTRLGLSADERRLLARAFLLDLVDAARAAAPLGGVTVIAGEEVSQLLPHGVTWIEDPGRGLNAAIKHASAGFDRQQLVMTLMGDLPCATSADLSLLFRLGLQTLTHPDANTHAIFLSDQTGVGTTALGARQRDLHPQFGHHSRAHHRADGAVELRDPRLTGLRRDVDSVVDLSDALRLGIGPRSQQAAHDLGLS